MISCLFSAAEGGFYLPEATCRDRLMSWKEHSLKAGGRVRVGRHAISVPSVPSMTDPDRPEQVCDPAGDSHRQPAIDRNAVQYLDRVRAIFRPTSSDNLAPGLSASSVRRTSFDT